MRPHAPGLSFAERTTFVETDPDSGENVRRIAYKPRIVEVITRIRFPGHRPA